MTRRKQFPQRVKEAILAKFGGRCAMCRCEITPATGLEFDHRLPLALGGEDKPENLEPLDKRCHRLKTKADVQTIRKADRQRGVSLGTKTPARVKIPSPARAAQEARDKLPLPERRSLYQ